MTISVGDQDRFRRRDEGAPVVDHLIERGTLENRSLALVNGEQVGKEVLLLARGGTELARQGLLNAKAGLICTAARLMGVEIGDGGKSVEQGLAVVSCTTLKQFGQPGYGVESPRRHSVRICTSPTSEKRASVSRSDGDFVGDLQSLLELGGHADKLIDSLLHVFDLGENVL